MDRYRREPATASALHTDADPFFRKATYPTKGLRIVLTDVVSRLTGENSALALHRLKTAVSGGETPVLIALIRLGFHGRELAAVTRGISDPRLLHAPGEDAVVGIADDKIPAPKSQDTDLIPYTIREERVYQVRAKVSLLSARN